MDAKVHTFNYYKLIRPKIKNPPGLQEDFSLLMVAVNLLVGLLPAEWKHMNGFHVWF